MIFILLFSSLLYWSPESTVGYSPIDSNAAGYEWWDQWLKKNVSATGEVNYKNMKPELGTLRSFTAGLGKSEPAVTATKNEQLAYWINLYNAATIQLVLEHYPLKSIRDIANGKPWDDAFISVGEKKYALNNIENDVLRKKFTDPRIHFAINCASKSCPKLLNGAYLPDKLDVQLNSMTKLFINDASKNKITATQIDISEIFNWYQKDFIQKGSVINFLNEWSATRISATASIHYLNYDWSLNEAP
ncbi:MAG: DUF547 domain-containing protein [Chitinophagaceae bacterium]|nr:DUF547 domain-containing protein [Chitinophagaceae bacterium]